MSEPENTTQSSPNDPLDNLQFEVVLASASPRRRDLLQQASVPFTVRVADVDESLEPDLLAQPSEAVKKLAERKAHAAVEALLEEGRTGALIVLGADTVVVLDGTIYGKPADESDAVRMLHELSGRTHAVHTGVSVWLIDAPADSDELSLAYRSFTDITRVTFRDLSDEEIAEYVATGEPLDKAGAYGYQERGRALVARIDGAEDTVIGLPVERLLREFPFIPRA